MNHPFLYRTIITETWYEEQSFAVNSQRISFEGFRLHRFTLDTLPTRVHPALDLTYVARTTRVMEFDFGHRDVVVSSRADYNVDHLWIGLNFHDNQQLQDLLNQFRFEFLFSAAAAVRLQELP
jgi:hypothetical protein